MKIGIMDRMKKLKWGNIWLVGLVALFFSCAETNDTNVIKLAHGLDVNHPVHKGMVFMAERVDEESKGALQIQIYPNSQLGSERECLELLQIGSIGMTKVSGAVLEAFDPDMRIFGIPYIFQDRDHFYRTIDGPIGDELLLAVEAFWLRGLTYFDAGARSFYTRNKPINTPADLYGLKIRVQESNTAMQMVASLGGTGTPLAWGELYTALQQGVVDGAENNTPSLLTSRHYEVCQYYSLNEHTYVPDLLMISKLVWDNLTDQEKGWLQAAADEASIYQRKLWQQAEIDDLAKIEAAGVTVIRPDKSLFAKEVEPMYEGFKDNEKLYKLIKQLRSEWK